MHKLAWVVKLRAEEEPTHFSLYLVSIYYKIPDWAKSKKKKQKTQYNQ